MVISCSISAELVLKINREFELSNPVKNAWIWGETIHGISNTIMPMVTISVQVLEQKTTHTLKKLLCSFHVSFDLN